MDRRASRPLLQPATAGRSAPNQMQHGLSRGLFPRCAVDPPPSFAAIFTILPMRTTFRVGSSFSYGPAVALAAVAITAWGCGGGGGNGGTGAGPGPGPGDQDAGTPSGSGGSVPVVSGSGGRPATGTSSGG